MTDKKPERVLAYIRDHSWAIQPASLETIIEIASRENEYDIDALATKVGKRLENSRRVEQRDNVAVLSIEGPLFRYANLFTMFSGAMSYSILALDFQAAVDNPAIDSIVLNINSPGGQTDGVNELASQIYAARSVKHITAYVSHLGASAAYLIASAAHEIVVEEMAAVGSIGTVAQIRTSKDKDTVELVSSQSPYKRPDVTTDAGKAKIQEYVDALAQVFIESVARNRSVSVDTVLKDYGQGGIMVGAQAVKARMADKVGTLESVIAGLTSNKTSTKVTFMNEQVKTIAISAITVAMLMSDRPDIVAELKKVGAAEGKAEGIKEGATAELARIKAVSEQTMPGHEALIAEMMFDGKTTGEQAAVKVLSAEKVSRTTQMDAARREAPKPANVSQDTPPPKTDGAVKKAEITSDMALADIKAAVKPEWDASAELRKEFQNDIDSYAVYRRQEASGRVHFLSRKEA